MLCKTYGQLLLLVLHLFSSSFAASVKPRQWTPQQLEEMNKFQEDNKRESERRHEESNNEFWNFAGSIVTSIIVILVIVLCCCCCVGGIIYASVRSRRPMMGQPPMMNPYAAPSYGAPGMVTAPSMMMPMQATSMGPPPVQSGPVTTPQIPNASR